MYQVKPMLTEQLNNSFVNEINLVSQFQHDNVRRLIGVVVQPPSAIYETVSLDLNPYVQLTNFCRLDHVLQTMHDQDAVGALHLGFDIIRRIAFDIANGLSYLHARKVAHLNLKPSSVLISNKNNMDEFCAKISDFEEAVHSDKRNIYDVTTRHFSQEDTSVPFLAPELVFEHTLSSGPSDLFPIDTWAYGCTLYCLLNPDVNYPFERERIERDKDMRLFTVIRDLMESRCVPRQSDKYMTVLQDLPEIQDIMESCFSYERNERPDMSSIARLIIYLLYK